MGAAGENGSDLQKQPSAANPGESRHESRYRKHGLTCGTGESRYFSRIPVFPCDTPPERPEAGYTQRKEKSLNVARHPDTVTHAWADALAAAGLPHVRLHDARQSIATEMHLRGQVPATAIAGWPGHTDARFTLSRYTHSDDEALTSAAESVDALMRKPAK